MDGRANTREVETEGPVFCRKCGAILTPGRGDFYVVEIEAYAENSPLVITEEELGKDHKAEMEQLAEELEGISEREAMDTVHRRVTFYLCRKCYQGWIEEPVG